MAALTSRAIGAKADYADGQRQSLPATVLANDYIAFKSVFQRKPDNAAFLQIPGSTTDYNQLFFYTPSFTPGEFLTEAFHLAAIACYEEFRVRCVKVVLHAPYRAEVGLAGAADKSPQLHSWMWFPDSHLNLNPAVEIGTYADMLESGEKIVPLAKQANQTLTMRAVPQILFASGTNAAGVLVFRDVPSPWLTTSAANLSATNYMPYFIWRLPYINAIGTVADYQITMHAIIEFRNPRDSQL